jgi:hypothetical protein
VVLVLDTPNASGKFDLYTMSSMITYGLVLGWAWVFMVYVVSLMCCGIKRTHAAIAIEGIRRLEPPPSPYIDSDDGLEDDDQDEQFDDNADDSDDGLEDDDQDELEDDKESDTDEDVSHGDNDDDHDQMMDQEQVSR